MRTLGLLLLAGGVLGFVYSSEQLGKLPPVPEGLSLQSSFDYPAGKWEVAKYAAAGAGLIGILFIMYPKGR